MGDILGSIGRTLFGGPSKEKSQSTQTASSGNYAYPELNQMFGGVAGGTGSASNMVNNLLGLNNGPSAPASPGPGVPSVMPPYSGSAGTTGSGHNYTGPTLAQIMGGSGGGQSGINSYMAYYQAHPEEDPGFSNISQFHGDPYKDESAANSVLRGRNAYLRNNPTGASPTTPTTPTTPAAGGAPSDPNAPQTSALEQFANSGGMQFLREQGMKSINADRSAKGLLQSGSTGTALTKLDNGLASTYLNQYMQNLFDQQRIGLGAGSLLSSAGQYSNSSGQSSGKAEGEKKGIAGDILNIAAAISDPRLKMNVKKIGQARDGLGKYTWEYTFAPGIQHEGVMANEVAILRPNAYLPGAFSGYDGVDYSKLGSLE